MRMVVDLPAPFGPRKPCTSPRSPEVEPVEGAHTAEGLHEARGLDHSGHERHHTLVSQICE